MNKPIGFETMSLTQQALEVALHELDTLNGLYATDIKHGEHFTIDVTDAAELIKKALMEVKGA